VRSASVDSLKDFYGNAGGPVGVAAIAGFKPGKVAGISGSQTAGCQGFGRAGGPVGPEAIRCGSAEPSSVASAAR